jgi:ferrochelatase
LLLINLGTPQSPDPADVRPYLREFLSDPRVLDMPAWRRWLILNLFILPFRPKESGKAYASIWTADGSPLLVHSRSLQRKIQQAIGETVVVELAMRYGRPSIAAALDSLRAAGVDRIVVFPLYPQYSSAATGSSVEKVFEEAGKRWNTPYLQVIPPFFDHPAFIDAAAAAARPVLDEIDPEKVFLSFHGLPEQQCRKSDEKGDHCLAVADCCERIVDANRNCYRAQCFATAQALADRLEIPEEKRVICFQSRLGRTPWIRPYTDEVLAEEARSGVRRAVILSPAFVADCLETVEELGIRGVEQWREAGGETLGLAPAVNADDLWVQAAIRIVRENTTWIGEPGESRPQLHSAEG